VATRNGCIVLNRGGGDRPDLAQHHEKLARAIEIAVVAASPRSPRPTVAPVDNPPRPDCQPAG
jgi:hypothetical protein